MSHSLKVRGTVFFVFRETSYKVRKNAKNSFLRRKQCFFFYVFRDTLYKVRKICEKTAFFLAFCTMSCKKCEKTAFFSRFSRHFVWIRRKCEKTAFFELFGRRPAKVWENGVFSRFSKTLCTKFAKMRKTALLWVFLHDVPQKVRENSVFSRFSRHFVQIPQNMRKNSFF